MTTTQQRPSHIDTVLALIDETLADYERSRAASFLASLPYHLQETSR
jgi:hypothetical protein